MHLVSITRLRVRSVFLLPLFVWHALRTMAQAQRADGIVHIATRFEWGNVVWTKTVWRDATTMKGYRNGGAHRLAMRLLAELCSEAAVARWEQASPEAPSWATAHERLLRDGRLSHVKRPSPLHAAGHTAPATMQPGFAPPSPPVLS